MELVRPEGDNTNGLKSLLLRCSQGSGDSDNICESNLKTAKYYTKVNFSHSHYKKILNLFLS